MSSNLAWNEHDEEKPWESDKFTVFDELAYQSGIDTAPDKGPDKDKQYADIYEHREYLHSDEGKIETLRSLAAHLLEDDIRSGQIDNSEYKELKSREYHHKPQEGPMTHGKFLNSLNNVDKDDNDDGLFDSDDDLFNDDHDEELDRKLRLIREQRLKELQNTQRNSSSNDISTQQVTDRSRLSQLVGPGVKAIVAEEFESEVKAPSKTDTVFMLIHNPSDRASQLMLTIINQLAKRLPRYKYTVINHSSALSHVPLSHCPVLMCYHKGQVVGSFSRLDQFNGSKTTVLDVEWTLAKCGIVDTDLTEDPRESALFD